MSVFEYTSFEDADFLLRRDWFVSDDDIAELLWMTDVDTYNRLVENKKAYSARIQFQLAPLPWMPASPFKNRRPTPKRPWSTLALGSCDAQ